MTAAQDIDYEALAQDAMRSVVRNVLTRVAKTGLPGEHHFYVAFNTQAPGVTISKRLKEKYPAEMTIVLQHRFWDLIVSEERFEVKLTFDSIPERLVVPFRAVKVFFDPSVPYGLQFEQSELGSETARRLGGDAGGEGMPDMSTVARNDGPVPVRTNIDKQRRERAPRRSKPEKPVEVGHDNTADVRPPAASSPPRAVTAKPQAISDRGKPAETDTKSDSPAEGGKVVRLDQFRKK
jgi:hypothetical protein